MRTVSLSWNKVKGADGYEVYLYKKKSKKSYNKIIIYYFINQTISITQNKHLISEKIYVNLLNTVY